MSMLKAFLSAWIISHTGVQAACLQDAVAPRKTVAVDGETMPIGIWVNGWQAGRIVAHIFQILLEEVLGYQATSTGEGELSSQAIFALAGCAPYQDCLFNESKSVSVRRSHFSLGTWYTAAEAAQRWQHWRPSRAPVRMADIGYVGLGGTYISSSALAAGVHATGLNLRAYSSYNSSVRDLSAFFHRTDDIDASLLATCNSSYVQESCRIAGDRGFEMYVKSFPDDAGGYYVDANGEHWPACHENLWWLAPACRSNPSKCIPWLASHASYFATEQMQLATLHNMPLAVGFAADDKAYAKIPTEHEILWYWWRPDATFLDKDPDRLVFPLEDFENLGWPSLHTHVPDGRGKWAMNGLRAPEPQQLAERMKITSQAMTAMMAAMSSGESSYNAACNWLKGNLGKSPWRSWIPRATDCVEGQGWADARGQAVSTLANATQCIWCPVGSVSGYDHRESSFVCKACKSGRFFDTDGKASCRDCDLGRFSSTHGQTYCGLCEVGTYTSNRGMTSCTRCRAGFITAGLGETNASGCGCAQGLLLSRIASNSTECVPCGWLYTTHSAIATSDSDCTLDMSKLLQLGLLAFALLASCVAAVLAALFRRYRRLVQDEALQTTVKQGFRSISVPQHPMCLMPFTCFCNLNPNELSACYEGARDRGSLLVLDSAQDIEAFQSSGRRVLFFSYSWTSWEARGPNPTQVECMKGAARHLREVTGIEPELFYIWLDILGIPQVSDLCKGLAVNSLYVYASKADYFVVICPTTMHEQTEEQVDIETYKSRAWCRIEQLAFFTCHGLGAMWYTTRPGELVPIDENWLKDAVHVFEGQMTCCRLGHPGKRECDRKLIVPTVLAIYIVLLKKSISGAPDDIQSVWEMMNSDRARTFPKAFEYNESGKVRHLELFGSAVDSIREAVSNMNTEVLVTRQRFSSRLSSFDRIASESESAIRKLARKLSFSKRDSERQLHCAMDLGGRIHYKLQGAVQERIFLRSPRRFPHQDTT
eukprot:TRINITY_DN6098_c0_g3_i1.p1 TRINITY_DN6098_c0_g3~~TRINITY_DN6098_c0_g3_i1.p1  ORF type:complete len:992 (+),score=65.41 TRINITY_DN6098_c0_g3_i1:54-3029(+)